MNLGIRKWGLSGEALKAFITMVRDEQQVHVTAPENLYSAVIELDEPGGDVTGWTLTDIDGNEVSDEFMETQFGSVLAGQCLMVGTAVEDEPTPGIQPVVMSI